MNIITNNSVAGSSHSGFWYKFLTDTTSQYCPNRMPLGEFKGNTVHSSGKYGLWIFPSYDPSKNGLCAVLNNPSGAVFSSLVSYSCDKGAEFSMSRNIHFTNFLIWDQFSLGIDTKSYDMNMLSRQAISYNNNYYGSVISNSVIVGDSRLTGTSNSSGLALEWDKGQLIANVSFYNFLNNQSTALRVTEMNDVCG